MYIGSDIEEISRIKHLFDKKPRILQKMFFISEWDYAMSKSNPYITLAGIWCAKEAIVKAFSPLISLHFNQIEISKNPKAYPEAIVHHADITDLEYHLSVSISHTKHIATATAILTVI